MNRRHLLALAGTMSVAGCSSSIIGAPSGNSQSKADSSDDSLNFKYRGATRQHERVLRTGPTAESGPPYFVTVTSSFAELKSQLYWDEMPENITRRLRQIETERAFAAVFLSRYEITPAGEYGPKRPSRYLDGETLVIEVDQAEAGQHRDDPFAYGETLDATFFVFERPKAEHPVSAEVRLV